MRANLAQEVGLTVKQLRESAGITQRELALRIGTTQSVIARVEAGRSKPSLTTLERIADAMDRELEVRFHELQVRHFEKPVPPRRSGRSRAGLDLAQLAANLRLSPAERLTRATGFSRWVLRNRGRALARGKARAGQS